MYVQQFSVCVHRRTQECPSFRLSPDPPRGQRALPLVPPPPHSQRKRYTLFVLVEGKTGQYNLIQYEYFLKGGGGGGRGKAISMCILRGLLELEGGGG